MPSILERHTPTGSKDEERRDGAANVTEQPQGRYRIQGEKGQPNIAFLEIGRIGLEVTEQEYRDGGYASDFGELPWKVGYRPRSETTSHEHEV